MDVLKRARFDKLLDKATSDTLTEPDIETTLTICDLIRGQEISAKTAVQSVKKRLQHENSAVVLQTIYVLECMMKNCGTSVHEEVATADFMQTFSSLTTKSFDIRSKVLACIHSWAYVFKGKTGFSAIEDTYAELKREGYTFPPFSENDTMFNVACAPNWKEEATCHRCKVAFGAFRRRHHCRNCGNSFCAECSSERAILPQFGIEKEVRVCTHCFEQISRGATSQEKKPQPNAVDQTQHDKEQRERELATQEAEELELALALSASEAESKERERRTTNPITQKSEDIKGTPAKREENNRLKLLPVLDTTDMDPELARYLNRHYWENRAASITNQSSAMANRETSPQPSAPIYAPLSVTTTKVAGQKSGTEDHIRNSSTNPPEIPELTSPKQEEFLTALRASIEFFVNRMQSNNQRGRSIANDTTVQALFLTLHEMHPQLLHYKQAMEDRRAYFESFQDKLTQLREAREALDALRQEHAARKQLEEQEAARLRQLQMMQKLEIMRQQKRETLEYRRRMALEQTMQYQQQYQPQPVSQPVDPSTGLSVPHAYPMPHPAYPPQSAYGVPGSYGVVPSTYGQPAMDPSCMYYAGPYMAQQYYPYNGHMIAQPQQPTVTQSNPFTQHSGVYHMQSLEASLPPNASQLSGYQTQSQTHYPSSSIPQTETQGTIHQAIADLPEPPASEPRPTSPNANVSRVDQAQPQYASENQLISFD